MTYKPFIVSDPYPWLDQFTESAGMMVKRCGGSSVEYVVNSILQACKNPNCAVFAAVPADDPSHLVAWMGCSFVPDTYQPWVEIWGFWIKPGLAKDMKVIGKDIIIDWARWRGAVRIVAIVTRSKRAYERLFLDEMKFETVGTVVERRL